tara:strand:+ start:244 stop:462 length:219 start_codon:yes stop_codon:yes gene_type:complete
MAYERQVQGAMDRLDQSLSRLYQLIKRGEQKAALRFMDEGELKERYEELQNMITISKTGNYGARGVQNTRPL